MEEVAKKYKGKAEFLFVYCREAHPEDNREVGTRRTDKQPIKQTTSIEERREIAKTFCDDMKVTRCILVDEFDEKSVQRLYGGLADPTVVVDVDGKIALKMPWTKGDLLDKFLEAFLAGGGKANLELAAAVPFRGPGRDSRPAQPSAPGSFSGFGGGMMSPEMMARMGDSFSGFGGGMMSPEMMARMAERTIDGLELTDAEAKAAKLTVQAKMQARTELRQKAMALDELARSEDATEAQIAQATKDFESAVADYQQAMAELDRKLTEQDSAKAKAKLLAAGILENGLGVTPYGMVRQSGGNGARPK